MSVSEQGELKKRIHQQAEYILGDWGKTDNALKEILDEAKKEFPKGKEGETSFEELAELFDARTEWFLKYFGTMEKTK
jgi:hypothetical protein